MDYLISKAKERFDKGDHIQAIQILEEMILVHKDEEESKILLLQLGKFLMKLALNPSENTDVKFTYALAAVSCVCEDTMQKGFFANSVYFLARLSGSLWYYKKFIKAAKLALAITEPRDMDSDALRASKLQLKESWKGLKDSIKKAEGTIAELKAAPLKKPESKVCESKTGEDEPPKNERKDLRKYWMGLDVKMKREFLKVSVADLLGFAQEMYKMKGREVLEKAVESVRRDKKWIVWVCRTCAEKFSSVDDCRNHVEKEHVKTEYKPSSEEDVVKPTGRDWALKITKGAWEPVDAVAAAEMIKNPLGDAKTFKANSGWSKEWPLAVDEERSKLLVEIKSMLTLIRDHKALSSSIRDWLVSFAVKRLGKLEVSEKKFGEFHLAKTPQSICFLDCDDLIHIRDFLKTIKCERDNGTDLVCRAVDSFLDRTRVKEKIDFDPEFSILLLDKRLLKSIDGSFDDEGTVNFFDPNNHYAEAPAKGDHIISWLLDYSSVDKTFPRPIKEYNYDIWVAVLLAVQFTCGEVGTKYDKKVKILVVYDVALTVVENICKNEEERRRNLQEEQWNSYASLLCDRCEGRAAVNSVTSHSFLFAVRDVLEGALHPTYDFSKSEDCLNQIREHKTRSDDLVMNSIHHLKSVVTLKVLRKDSKILLVDNSRTRLLDKLMSLSFFDNRTYMLRMLKPFLLNEIINMELKVKSDAASADFLRKEEKSQPAKKNKQNKNIKGTSTSMSKTHDKIAEHESSVKVELEKTSPPLETVEEEPKKQEETIAGDRGGLDISSSTDNQEGTTIVDHDTQNMPEPLESALGEAATIYNSAFDMTLKALLNIKVLKEDLKKNGNLENQVPWVLQNLFKALRSEEIKYEGLYGVLLSEFLAKVKEVIPMVCVEMSSDAAEVLVDILDLWQCWKNPERESLVIHLFTFEENERMSCRRCKRESNDPEKYAYGIVVAAESIRVEKCAFGYLKFVDILKLIRMGNKMLCDENTEGCGKTNYVHHTISKCPLVFTIALKWEKSTNEIEVSETTNALEWEIDISKLYEGLEPNTMYRLVSMVGCCKEDHICLAYEENRWFNLGRESFEGEDVGDWKNVVKFCEERKVWPEILFYEAA